MLVGLLLVSCTWLAGSRAMGEACDAADQCVGEGVCLAGVCGGYGCETDDDCENGLTCADIDGVDACAQACATDDDCSGDQACREDGYCL